MQPRSAWEIVLGTCRGVATCPAAAGAIAGIALGGAATAQARPHFDSPGSAHGADSTGFVHKIQWTSSSPATGVTLLSGVYADPYWTVTIQAPVQSPFRR